jgi:hypothetical protein
MASGAGEELRLDGFTVTAGKADRPSDDPNDPMKYFNERRGAGVFVEAGDPRRPTSSSPATRRRTPAEGCAVSKSARC